MHHALHVLDAPVYTSFAKLIDQMIRILC